MTVIHDLSNVGRHNLKPVVFQVIQRIAAVDQDHFPESLHQLFIVNTPMVFYGIWKVIEKFLQERTRKKIRILGKKYHTELFEAIEKEKVPAFLGGSCECHPSKEFGGCVTSKSFTDTNFFLEIEKHISKT